MARILTGLFAGLPGAASALIAALTPREQVGHALWLLQTASYSARLAEQHVRQSVGCPGVCWDNAVAESFFATLGYLSPTEFEDRYHRQVPAA